jgi:hypothetical protein
MKRIFGILMIALMVACEKEKSPLPTELPPITEEGKNTFGCMIGDEIYVPEIRTYVCCEAQAVPIIFDFPESPIYLFRVSTVRYVDRDDQLMDAMVEFSVDSSLSKVGEYQFSHMIVKHENVYYYMDTTESNLLNISIFDSINGIISGTFYCTLIDKNNTNSKMINITNGRFDLKKQ